MARAEGTDNDAGAVISAYASAPDTRLTELLRTRSVTAYPALQELRARHRASVLTYARLCATGDTAARQLAAHAFTAAAREAARGTDPGTPVRHRLLLLVGEVAAQWAGDERAAGLDAGLLPTLTAAAPAPPLLRAFRALPPRTQGLLWYGLVEREPEERTALLLGLTPADVTWGMAPALQALSRAALQVRLTDSDDPDCQDFRRLIEESVRPDSPRHSPDLATHMAHCPHCTTAYEEQCALRDTPRTALAEGLLGWGGAAYASTGAGAARVVDGVSMGGASAGSTSGNASAGEPAVAGEKAGRGGGRPGAGGGDRAGRRRVGRGGRRGRTGRGDRAGADGGDWAAPGGVAGGGVAGGGAVTHGSAAGAGGGEWAAWGRAGEAGPGAAAADRDGRAAGSRQAVGGFSAGAGGGEWAWGRAGEAGRGSGAADRDGRAAGARRAVGGFPAGAGGADWAAWGRAARSGWGFRAGAGAGAADQAWPSARRLALASAALGVALVPLLVFLLSPGDPPAQNAASQTMRTPPAPPPVTVTATVSVTPSPSPTPSKTRTSPPPSPSPTPTPTPSRTSARPKPPATASATPKPPSPPNGTFGQVVNAATGRCLDVRDGWFEDGVDVITAACSGSPTQQWRYDAERRVLQSYADQDYCLDSRGSTDRGVGIWSCDSVWGRNGANLMFSIDGEGRIRPYVDPDTAVTATGGDGVWLGRIDGGAEQRWRAGRAA